MFGLKTFVTGLTLGSVTTLFALNFHVLNTPDGLIVLPRASRPPLRTTYVDVRKWSLSMWKQHPDVAQSVIRYGRPDLLADGALNSIFPQQTEVEPVSNSADGVSSAQKAKMAMEALIPIKFSNENGETIDFSPKVPEPVLPESFPTKQYSPPPSTSRTSNFVPSSEPVLPEAQFNVDESFLAGLPRLQNPIPIFEDESDLAVATTSSNKKDQVGKFFDILKAVVPQKNSEQAVVDVNRQQGASHSTFRVQAPVPGSGNDKADDLVLPQQAPNAIPVVRPF